jgi:hypothetical protein
MNQPTLADRAFVKDQYGRVLVLKRKNAMSDKWELSHSQPIKVIHELQSKIWRIKPCTGQKRRGETGWNGDS